MEKKIRNKGFWSFFVDLMIFNGGKIYYKVIGKIYYMCSYFFGESCYILVVFFWEGRELIFYLIFE